ncbi:hypothetical protein PVAP13_8KG242300 [Panicum virgatum]|uniref:Tyrosinase copper-binding domain-containing protein n=1 Tax=Panicum virgatum TaxID=38727 RepID=A0A8T0PM09_PANVG|nr:hypothetical protein PVAP13_8KG242300 [Panicum virgatum]
MASPLRLLRGRVPSDRLPGPTITKPDPDDPEIQIHGCWLFLTWHRLYLYFHERILGKLIGDKNFALPFWNWDAPDGMTFPAIYTNETSPLYNNNRNPNDQPPATVDLDYSCNDDEPLPSEELIIRNLNIMYRQMVSGAKTQTLFFGHRYCQGDRPRPGAGTIELQPHNLVHDWTGDPSRNHGEDMGVLGTAARDPVFFAHHGNIDRMWYIRRNCLRPGNTNFTDSDWLDARFLFYDEEARLVRVRVGDCLDTRALGYTYQDVEIPWLNARPTPAAGGYQLEPANRPAAALPRTPLGDTTVRVEVTRARTSRGAEEKRKEEEVLVIEGIRIADPKRCVKFDVFVNAPRGGAADAAAVQCAGSFALTPHAMGGSFVTAATFGITELLDAIGADQDKKVVVSIVPRAGGDTVTIGGVGIDYIPIE